MAKSVREAAVTLEDEQHRELEDRFHEVEVLYRKSWMTRK